MVVVTCVLARGPGAPDGDTSDRLQFQAILTSQGRLDEASWESGEDVWTSSRDRPGHARRTGEVVKIAEGWALRGLHSEDDPLYTLHAGLIRPGEILSVSRLDGDEMIYRIVAVEPA